MKIGSSIFLAAVGAILYWAVDYSVSGLDLKTVGVILMIAGAVGLVLSLLLSVNKSRSVTTVQDGSGQVQSTKQSNTTVL